MQEIEDQIKNWKSEQIILSVSAASNVTSQVTDLKSLNEIISKNYFYFKKCKKI